MGSMTVYSPQTHIEILKVPSLFDNETEIDVNLYINKTYLQENTSLPTIVFIYGGGLYFKQKYNIYFQRAYTRQEIDYENPYFNPTKSKNLLGLPEAYLA